MKTILFIKALFKMLVGLALLAVMLFVPAGTWQFYQAWVMLGGTFCANGNNGSGDACKES